MTPGDRRYAKSHEWVKVEGKTATVGISDHAQSALGDITFIEFPRVGHVLRQGSACGVLESVKAASDIYAPVSGKVMAINTMLEDKPEKVNEDPYQEGWLFKIEQIDESGLAVLLNAAEYEALLDSEK